MPHDNRRAGTKPPATPDRIKPLLFVSLPSEHLLPSPNMPPSKLCNVPAQQDIADAAILAPLCADGQQVVHSRTFDFASTYLRIIRKVATLDCVKLPSRPHYICAFIASEQ